MTRVSKQLVLAQLLLACSSVELGKQDFDAFKTDNRTVTTELWNDGSDADRLYELRICKGIKGRVAAAMLS